MKDDPFQESKKSLFKVKNTYWEAERLPNGKWFIVDPNPTNEIHLTVPHDWFMRNFKPVTGSAFYQMSEEVKHAVFKEN